MNAFLIKAFICRRGLRVQAKGVVARLLRITIKLLQQRWLCTVAKEGLLTLEKQRKRGVDYSRIFWVLLGANVHSFGTNALQSSRIANSSRRCSFQEAFAPVFLSHLTSGYVPEKLAPKMEVYELRGIFKMMMKNDQMGPNHLLQNEVLKEPV